MSTSNDVLEAKMTPVDPALSCWDITTELWREYDFAGRKYRIKNPKLLYYRRGGSTHRVVDAEGVAHCLPAPGEKGCVLTWKTKDENVPVNF
jgi:hypothetical protein